MSAPAASHPEEHPKHVPAVAQIQAKADWASARRAAVNIGVGLATALCAASALKYFEGWSFFEAVFVLCQIQTTVGYGGFHLATWHAELILAIYACSSIVIAASLLKLSMKSLSNRYEVVLRWHLRRIHELDELEQKSEQETPLSAALRSLSVDRMYGELSKVLVGGMVFMFFILVGTFFFRYAEHCACAISSKTDNVKCDATTFETCAATGGSIKSFSDAFYLSVTTMASIGFGEVQPRTNAGKCFSVVWMLLGVFSTANFITGVSQYFLQGRWKEVVVKREFMLDIHEKEFALIDSDKSGDMSQAEFLIYTLRKYGCISEELVAVINREFDEIDTDGNNAVTWEMLKRRKMGVQEAIGALDNSPFLEPLPQKHHFMQLGDVRSAIAGWRHRVGMPRGKATSDVA
mmetsp:Transcript_69216/g.129187  ORF Transcript_69216/g.129187 Transcript_69216/m.129187 type:complete len:406 (+) Transcript_69216:138-1355(+)